MSARNIVELLDQTTDDLLARLAATDEMRAVGRAHYMMAVAIDLCHVLAEGAHDCWDPPALREALRDILAACRHVQDTKAEATDRMLGNPEDRRGLAGMLGVPEDADAQTVMAALARFNTAGGAKREPPPDGAPA